MHVPSARTRRLLAWVEAMKRRRFPNSRSLARELAQREGRRVSSRTLQRDLDYLRLHLDAPVEYDSARYGYYLTDPEWCFPLEELRGDLLYASLLGEAFSATVMPDPLRYSLQEAMRIRLAAAEPDDFDPGLLRAVVFATGATAELAPDVFDVVHQAWRERRRLRLSYQGTGDDLAIRRDVDVHALFLSQGAWYARAFCHLRQAPRSLAIHRIHDPVCLDERFARNPALLDAVRRGSVFDYEVARDVVVVCDPGKARVIAEREWFPGQVTVPRPDGGLCLAFPEVPKPDLVHWVMSYCGHLTVREPPDLVAEVRKAAERIVQSHEP